LWSGPDVQGRAGFMGKIMARAYAGKRDDSIFIEERSHSPQDRSDSSILKITTQNNRYFKDTFLRFWVN
jgi:hypothetical protein